VKRALQQKTRDPTRAIRSRKIALVKNLKNLGTRTKRGQRGATESQRHIKEICGSHRVILVGLKGDQFFERNVEVKRSQKYFLIKKKGESESKRKRKRARKPFGGV